MRSLVVLALFALTCVLAATYRGDRSEFGRWSSMHGKSYSAIEMRARYAIWRKNVEYVNTFNSRNASFTVAVNEFADMTADEFGKFYRGARVPANYVHANPTITGPRAAGLPDSYDWRQQGAVTHVKNQQQCGSCWSFSTTGSVEGCHYLATKNLVELSEQNLVDCSTSQGNQGCNGGLMTQAMQYIISNGGIDTEQSYPYTAEDGTCHYSASNSGSTLSSFSNVASGDEGALQNSVYKGPTSIAIDASQSSFQFYSSGVYSDPDCSSSQLDHGVLAIGWGHDSSSSMDYWIVKNSWGTSWGQEGYIWMARNDNNMCGVATMATLPTGCS